MCRGESDAVWRRAELRVEQLRSALFIFGVYFAYFGLRIYFGRMLFARGVPHWLQESQIIRRHHCRFTSDFRRVTSSHTDVLEAGNIAEYVQGPDFLTSTEKRKKKKQIKLS